MSEALPEQTVIRPVTGADEYPALVRIWARAVEATHDFLDAADRDRIRARLVADYFPQVLLTVAERGGRPVGFAGTAAGGLEMLFVDPAVHGTGVGSALLAHVRRRQGVTRVDVNERNAGALAFYRARGCIVTGRSPLDDAGRPYPLLHLRVPAIAT